MVVSNTEEEKKTPEVETSGVHLPHYLDVKKKERVRMMMDSSMRNLTDQMKQKVVATKPSLKDQNLLEIDSNVTKPKHKTTDTPYFRSINADNDQTKQPDPSYNFIFNN